MHSPVLNPVPTSYDYRPPTEPWLTVLHADDDIVVLDKPSGLLSVAGKDLSLADCLEARVKGRWPTAAMAQIYKSQGYFSDRLWVAYIRV